MPNIWGLIISSYLASIILILIFVGIYGIYDIYDLFDLFDGYTIYAIYAIYAFYLLFELETRFVKASPIAPKKPEPLDFFWAIRSIGIDDYINLMAGVLLFDFFIMVFDVPQIIIDS